MCERTLHPLGQNFSNHPAVNLISILCQFSASSPTAHFTLAAAGGAKSPPASATAAVDHNMLSSACWCRNGAEMQRSFSPTYIHEHHLHAQQPLKTKGVTKELNLHNITVTKLLKQLDDH